MFKKILPVLLITQLIGCSYITPSFIENRENTYLHASSIPPLKIPPGLETSHFSSRYPISERSYPSNSMNVSIVPPGL